MMIDLCHDIDDHLNGDPNYTLDGDANIDLYIDLDDNLQHDFFIYFDDELDDDLKHEWSITFSITSTMTIFTTSAIT